ncbi:MAG: class II aldolase [Pelagibacterales bacterium]|nr:class II aldolase [Pelagibacterales bacterium]|tara:strand:+ start:6663 stop:7310 length:648 start_codon:yes stop_codon:yes gene_type:complete
MKNIKTEIINYAKKLNLTNLSPLRSGNISVRTILNNKKGFYITPSGIKYEKLKTKDIVFVSLDGKYDKEGLDPSSEWRFHQDIYKDKSTVKAIVHAHSPYSTALSSFRKNIPSFHYMVALAGGNSIKCAKYATYGTRELSVNILQALKNRYACLISNHGQVSIGSNIANAFELAEEVENLSHQYLLTMMIGKPKLLTNVEMNNVLKKIKSYKNNL